jgi:hypothetical protein
MLYWRGILIGKILVLIELKLYVRVVPPLFLSINNLVNVIFILIMLLGFDTYFYLIKIKSYEMKEIVDKYEFLLSGLLVLLWVVEFSMVFGIITPYEYSIYFNFNLILLGVYIVEYVVLIIIYRFGLLRFILLCLSVFCLAHILLS